MQPTISVREAARLLSVAPRTVRNWIHEGRLSAIRVSERITLIPLGEIERVGGRLLRPDLSSVIWDVDLAKLDEERSADFIIRRVLEAGRPEQVAWLFRRYGDARIADTLERSPGLPRSVSVAWRELLRMRRDRVA